MRRIVVHPVVVVAGPYLRQTDAEDAVLSLEGGHAREPGGLTLPQIRIDQADVVPHRITLDAHLGGEGIRLPRLLDALPGRAVLPAVIAAADGVALDPAGRKLGAPVGAPPRHQVGLAVLSPVQGELLVQYLDGDCAPGRDILGAIERKPETPEVSPRQRVRAGVNVVRVVQIRGHGRHLPAMGRLHLVANSAMIVPGEGLRERGRRTTLAR